MNQNPKADAVIDDFLARHQRAARGDAVFEQLRSGSDYFSLERRGASGDRAASYVVLRSPASQGVDRLAVTADAVGRAVRGSIPIIPTLLSICGRDDWATEARAFYAPAPSRSFLFDALRLPGVHMTLQLDWRDAKVPDGFKLGATFQGEAHPTFYPLHNDVIARAIETKGPILGQALRICPEVFARAVANDADLLSRWDAAALEEELASNPAPVRGHRNWL